MELIKARGRLMAIGGEDKEKDCLILKKFVRLAGNGKARIDEYFDYSYGRLPYRSLEFKHETHDVEQFQPATIINYPNEQAFTRITEFKKLTGQEHKKTSIVYEFPRAEGDPYYPVPRKENQELYASYKALTDKTENVRFVGRLATYRYYNMDQIVAQSLTEYSKIVGAKRQTATQLSAKKEPVSVMAQLPKTKGSNGHKVHT